MINLNSVQKVDASWLSPGQKLPLYGSYCFSEIPSFLQSYCTGNLEASTLPLDVLGGFSRSASNVVCLFVDAFGWRFLEQFSERFPFVSRLCEEGIVSKLTSQFPSTTAAHVTTIHTGMPVHQTGICEWFYYEPLAGQVIAPLLFSSGRNALPRENLRKQGIRPETIFPFETLYQRLAAHGWKSIVFQNRNYAQSGFSNQMCRGATVVPFKNVPHGMDEAARALREAKEKTYCFLYVDTIDSALHQFGPASPKILEAADTVFTAIENILMPAIQQKKDTLLMVIADHGSEAVWPERVIFLDKEFPGFDRYIATDPETHEILIPAGSPRDMFLHLKPGTADEVTALLREKISDRVIISATRDLMASQLFGPAPSNRLHERLGDLILFPQNGWQVWWSENGKFDPHFFGNHGGLTAHEAEIVFGVWGSG